MATVRTASSGWLLTALLLLPAPLAGAQEETAESAPAAEQEQQSKEAPPDPKKLERKLDKVSRELDLARIELKIAELSNRIKLTASRSGLTKAEQALADARQALDHFQAHTKPVTLEQADIKLQRSANRADHARDEYEELKAMYEAEEFAEMTKELVLKRGRRNLELSERDLAVERRSFDMVDKYDLPKTQTELERKLEGAQEDLATAQLELEKEDLSALVSLTKARHKLADLELDLQEAQAELEKVASPVEQ